MAVGQTEEYGGPHVDGDRSVRGVLELVGGVAVVGLVAMGRAPAPALLLAAVLAIAGARDLYLAINRKPTRHVFYTLTPDALKYNMPGVDVALHVPWHTMRRVETLPTSLRLSFVASADTMIHDNVPALGHKFNTAILGDVYRKQREAQATESARVIDLDPATTTTDGATLGERFPHWVAQYATQAETV